MNNKTKKICALIIITTIFISLITFLFILLLNLHIPFLKVNSNEFIFGSCHMVSLILLLSQLITLPVIIYLKKYDDLNKKAIYINYKIYFSLFIVCVILVFLARYL